MTLNTKELSFCFSAYDAEDMQRYEKAEAHLKATLLQRTLPQKGQTTSDYVAFLQTACADIFEYFTILFGEEANRIIFGGKTNLVACINALIDFHEFVGLEDDSLRARLSKYSKGRVQRK